MIEAKHPMTIRFEEWDRRQKDAERVRRMTKVEILNLFEDYGFVDNHGHPIRNCADFRVLVEMAMEGKDDSVFHPFKE